MRSKLLCALTATTLAVTVGAAAAHPRAVTDSANLRSGPGAGWPVIAIIPAEAQVNVLNCGPGWKRDWCHVRYENATGYVAAGALAPSGNTVIVAPLVTTDLANLRSGPGSKWGSVATIPPGTQVDSSGCIKGWLGSWCHVTYEGKTGYVHQSLLTRSGALFAQ